MAGSNGQLINMASKMYGGQPAFSGYASPFNYNSLSYGLSGLGMQPNNSGMYTPPQFQGPQAMPNLPDPQIQPPQIQTPAQKPNLSNLDALRNYQRMNMLERIRSGGM